MPSNDLTPGHGAGWLNDPHGDERPAHGQPEGLPTGPISPISASDPVVDRTGAHSKGFRIRARTALFATCAVGTLAGTFAGLGVAMVPRTFPATTPTLATAYTPTPPKATTPHPVRACTGLQAATVTDGAGDATTVAGVIAKFQHAYYTQRNVDAALALVGPQSGVTREGLTPVIAALPAGVTHCVGIDVIAENTAEVHVVELRADGARSDYLQLVNLAPGPSGLVITNVQKRGN
ncbi:hypothetical protein [Nocardia asteroides]|uniref:hypothetical protein n=1 Tax=Nocardia asteroides TaxID=1824 RepID=UPI0033D45C8F